MSEPIIKVKNVTKVYRLYKSNKERMKSVLFRKGKYKKKKAVNNVSLEIYKGETAILLYAKRRMRRGYQVFISSISQLLSA